jgi:tRNA(Ile)-lysidine synthase
MPAMAKPLAPIERVLLKGLRESGMLAPGDRLGVAVSGGADSVALLHLLHALRARLGVTLVVVHFDHCLRGVASDEDARFVAELARSLSLECVVDREDVRAAAARHKWNLEDAGRRLRYAFFDRMMIEKHLAGVAVAHTADDQAETVLSRLIRGTGPAGLSAIHPVVTTAAGRVIRPLLDFRRSQLRDYLGRLGQAWREDATNQDVTHLRARIRSRLLPLLETEFSPGVVDHLSNLASLSSEQEVFWDALADESFRRLAQRTGEQASIAVADLLAPMPLAFAKDAAPLRALTERLIRKMYAAVRSHLRNLTSVQVEQVIRLAARSTSGHRVELPGGISARRDFDQIIFSAPARSRGARTAASYAYALRLPERGSTSVSVLELHTRFLLKVIDWPKAQRETRQDAGALDAELLASPLVLRNWRPGDSYRPRARHRNRKLKDMMRAARIASGERSVWPVLESCGRIAWARGLPPAGDFCAHEGTRLAVLIECAMPGEAKAPVSD